VDNTVKITPQYIISPQDLWQYAECTDVTLGDVLTMIYNANIEYPYIAEMFGMGYIDAFYEELIRECPLEDRSDICYLELYWGSDFDMKKMTKEEAKAAKLILGRKPRYKEDYNTIEIGNLMQFGGVGFPEKEDKHSIPDKDGMIGYAIEMTPVYKIAHLPIKINKKFNAYPYPVEDKSELKCIIDPTVYTFFTSICWELTFMGHPADRDGVVDGLKKQIDEIKDGTIKTVPWEEAMKDFEDLIPEEDEKEID